MRYVKAKWMEHQKDFAYRIYITDSLFAIGQGKGLVKRYFEIIQPEKVDDRTGDEIALDVIQRLGLKVEE